MTIIFTLSFTSTEPKKNETVFAVYACRNSERSCPNSQNSRLSTRSLHREAEGINTINDILFNTTSNGLDQVNIYIYVCIDIFDSFSFILLVAINLLSSLSKTQI